MLRRSDQTSNLKYVPNIQTNFSSHLFHRYGKNKELRFFRLRSKTTETHGDALQDWGHFEKEQCFFSLPHADPGCRLPRSWSAKLQAYCHRAASHIPPAAHVLAWWLLLSPLWGMLSCNVISSFIPLKKSLTQPSRLKVSIYCKNLSLFPSPGSYIAQKKQLA